jgi:AcrR family transcriptional regulator
MPPATLQQRRAPSQARGHQRVKALLDATAHLLEEVGYEALTTKAIAERARTSIGSFYQFFPNRDAAVAALVDRYREEIRHYVRASVRDHFRDGAQRTGVEGLTATWVGSVVEGLRALFHSLPGFGRLYSSSVSEGSLGPHTDRLRREVLDSLEELMGEAFPEVPEARRHRSMLMVVETARAVLGRIPYVDEATGATLRAELDEMLAIYLAASFEAEP